MEAYNTTIKRSYTLGLRHTLPALFDVFKCLMLDLSLDVISGRKTYETIRKPPWSVLDNANKIDNI
jgi:dihydrofolate reductase